MEEDIKGTEKFQELVNKVTKKFEKEDITLDTDEIEDETLFALLEYYNDRHFNPKEDELYEPIYEGIIVKLAVSALAKKGAEGETSHNEGGVGRGYDNASDYPLSLTRKIIPLAKGVGK